MSVYKVPGWMTEPCKDPGSCLETGVHSSHIKPWARWLFRMGLLR